MRALLIEFTAASLPLKHRQDEIARIRSTVETAVAGMLAAAGTPEGLEAAAAADVIDGIFRDPLLDQS